MFPLNMNFTHCTLVAARRHVRYRRDRKRLALNQNWSSSKFQILCCGISKLHGLRFSQVLSEFKNNSSQKAKDYLLTISTNSTPHCAAYPLHFALNSRESFGAPIFYSWSSQPNMLSCEPNIKSCSKMDQSEGRWFTKTERKLVNKEMKINAYRKLKIWWSIQF